MSQCFGQHWRSDHQPVARKELTHALDRPPDPLGRSVLRDSERLADLLNALILVIAKQQCIAFLWRQLRQCLIEQIFDVCRDDSRAVLRNLRGQFLRDASLVRPTVLTLLSTIK